MPRQVRTATLNRHIAKGTSPTKTTRRTVYSPKCKEPGGIGDSAVGTVKSAHNALSVTGIAQEADRGMDTQGVSLSMLAALGIGVASEISAVGANYSLEQVDTDTTVIPNAYIIDIKTLNRKSLGSKLISPIDKFKSNMDPFYTPDQCPPESSKAYEYKVKMAQRPNTISISNDLIKTQRGLQPKYMMTELRVIFGHNQDQ
mgnify:CR=1 FL=1